MLIWRNWIVKEHSYAYKQKTFTYKVRGWFPPLHPQCPRGAFKQIYSLIWDINISYLNMSFANAILKTGSFRSDIQALISERLNEPYIFWNAEQWKRPITYSWLGQKTSLTPKLPALVRCKTLSKVTRDIHWKLQLLIARCSRKVSSTGACSLWDQWEYFWQTNGGIIHFLT